MSEQGACGCQVHRFRRDLTVMGSEEKKRAGRRSSRSGSSLLGPIAIVDIHRLQVAVTAHDPLWWERRHLHPPLPNDAADVFALAGEILE
jgi:hypothetical protein